MIRLAFRNLFQNKTRLLISVGGVALALLLILALDAIFTGVERQPTANLDSKIGHEIMRLLRRVAKEQERSVVIVSHDQRIQDIADRVLWLENGEFKERVAMAVAPVCGMSVQGEKALRLEWEGQEFFFCARGCRDEFLGSPQNGT